MKDSTHHLIVALLLSVWFTLRVIRYRKQRRAALTPSDSKEHKK